MAEREESRNQRVALAAKATLRCACGSVGIITEEDVGNGCVACPGCDKKFCIECGNDWHEGHTHYPFSCFPFPFFSFLILIVLT